MIIAVIVSAVLLSASSDNTNDVAATEEDIEAVQLRSLKNFHLKTGGETWINSDGWNLTGDDKTHHCTWFGIRCGGLNDVQSISLPNNNLTSSDYDFAEIQNITSIQELDLSLNSLDGDVTNLTTFLSSLSAFRKFDFRFNIAISGIVSSEICSNSDVSILVDCFIDCECCDHEALCDCVDMVDFEDSEGNNCLW